MSFAGVLLLWSAMHHPEVNNARAQQPMGYAHAWGTRFGTVFNDEGRGIAVTNDGSVIWTGTTLDLPNTSEELVPMTFVKKYDKLGVECWTVQFVVEGAGANSVVSRALALADPTVDLPTDGLAYVAGRFKGLVSFGVTNGPGSASYPASFVAKIKEVDGSCPGGAAQAEWVTAFTTAGTLPVHRNSALAVAAGRTRRDCGIHEENVSDALFSTVAVGGFFNGTTTFNGPVGSIADDAYIALLHGGTGGVTGLLIIGGVGNQRITALAIDERTQDLFVAGWYDNTNTNFNPDPNTAPVYSSNYQNGRDMFVARIRLGSDRVPRLITLWTHGTPSAGPDYDDEASCLALGVNDDAQLSTLAFVGGWTASASTGRDLYLAAVRGGGLTKWVFNPAASGDERVLAVAADGLGRPVFTGHFGCPTDPGAPPCMGTEPLDFDPHEASSLVLAPQGQDAFVARYHPTAVQVVQGVPRPRLDWAYRVGGNFDESATAIAFDPAYTGRFALTGWFGRPDAAPGQYAINPDPAGVTPPVTSAGFADAFLSVHRPAAPQNVGFQISLVLDTSCLMDDPDLQPSPFDAMMTMIKGVMSSPGAIPLPGGTRQAAVQVNAIFTSSLVPTMPTADSAARVVMPWTVIDDDTAGLFARRLAATPAPHADPQTPTAHLSDGFRQARDQLAASGVGAQAHAGLLLLTNSYILPALQDARNQASASGFFDRICALAAQREQRNDLLENAIAPAVPDAPTPQDIDRRSTGIAAYSDLVGDLFFNYCFATMLQRLSWCPSDFNRDECTDNNGGAADDFRAWFQAGADPYRDWNLDGVIDDVPLPFGIDGPKLDVGFADLPPAPNRRVCNTCP